MSGYEKPSTTSTIENILQLWKCRGSQATWHVMITTFELLWSKHVGSLGWFTILVWWDHIWGPHCRGLGSSSRIGISCKVLQRRIAGRPFNFSRFYSAYGCTVTQSGRQAKLQAVVCICMFRVHSRAWWEKRNSLACELASTVQIRPISTPSHDTSDVCIGFKAHPSSLARAVKTSMKISLLTIILRHLHESSRLCN